MSQPSAVERCPAWAFQHIDAFRVRKSTAPQRFYKSSLPSSEA